MANDGNSSDNRLARAVTSGWFYKKNKWVQEPIKLPEIKDTDDIHQVALKEMLYRYYNLYHFGDSYSMNKRISYSSRVIIRMNQYRLKYWYWKAIN